MIIESLPGDVCFEILNGRYKSSPEPLPSPSYVDDVIEGYLEDGIFYNTEYDEPSVCEPDTSKIYVDMKTKITYMYSDISKRYEYIADVLK